MNGNYCDNHKDEDFEDIPPEYYGSTTVKWIRCEDCGYTRGKVIE